MITSIPYEPGNRLVVDHGAETDPRLLAVADQVIAGTDGLTDWLAELARAVREK